MSNLLARALVLAAAATALTGATAGAAQAAPASCPARVTVPNVKITSTAVRTVPMKLTQTCQAWAAFWILQDGAGQIDETQGTYGSLGGGLLTFPEDVMFEPTKPLTAGVAQSLRIRHNSALGTQTLLGLNAWAPGAGEDAFEGVSLPIAHTRFHVRAGSAAGITANRKGTRVTLGGKVTRYTPAARKFTGWRQARVVMQWRPTNTSAWRNLTTVRTGANGVVPTRSWSFSKSALFRFSVDATGTTWGDLSAQVRR
ncbi:hypothetical protein GCM10010124_27540 [Pilimelia terevasa]|uniref:Uncharacterized protein n=1 Tax=Pilimelia terevasa TaxID=53372 RepID=A0A8J3BMY8_9ACTN|nr:hypothetical protein [Pilimelia terevasa]GGK33292.1 hypothetical protein GCM10010124_27540 [Pilimelia terevasa]